MRFTIALIWLFGIVLATNCWCEGSVEKKVGGYIYSGPVKERLAPYLEKLRSLKAEIASKRKELETLKKQIRDKRLRLTVIETKLNTIEKLKRRLFFRRDFDLYVVKEGDTLWSISGKNIVYGNPMEWERLYTANRDVISDPHLIYPGQILIVPRIK